MKKTIFLLLCISSISAFSQSPLEKGELQLNAGVGASGIGIPVYVGLDFGIAPDITLGADASYRSYNQSAAGIRYNSTIIGLGVNGNYHFNTVLDIPSEWNLYAGLGVGYFIWNYENSNFAGANASGIGVGLQIGGRYFFSENFGLNLELDGGSTTSGGKFGITYKL
jgi:outer membrane immunogenic protein